MHTTVSVDVDDSGVAVLTLDGSDRLNAFSGETARQLGAAYRRIARHRGADVAVFAMARRLAQLVYRMLRYGQDYIDIGEAAYESRFQARRLAGLRETARSMGYSLTPEPTAAAAPTG